MKRTRLTRTTLEMREVFVIKGSRLRKRVLCTQCSERTPMVTVREAINMSGISARSIYRVIEEGGVHFAEMSDGSTLICAATLLAKVT